MNQEPSETIGNSPDKLLRGFRKTRFLTCLLWAAVIHVVLIGATSFTWLYDHVIDREGAKLRKAAVTNQVAAAAVTGSVPSRAAATGIPGAAVAAQTTTPSAVAMTSPPPAAAKTEGELIRERGHTAVVKEITEVAKPSEIPSKPDDIGISIKDTSPR